MIVNQTPYPISFEREMSQAITCRYGEEMRQYIFKPDVNVSGLSCLLQIAKPDGTFTENGVEVHTDPDTGECTLVITIPQQATVVKGVARYSICCYGEVETETHLLYSAEGPLWVDDDLITEEMIQSVAEVNGYTFPQDFVTIDMLSEIIPEALPAEYGFYLRAAQDTGAPEWAPIDMPYPGYGPSDAGKSLTVNADGTGVEWKNVQHDYSTQEQVVGKWINNENLYERIIQFSNVSVDGGSSDFKYKGDLMIKSIIPNADIILPDPQHSYYVVNSVKFSFIGFRVNCDTGELVVVTLFPVYNADLHICLQYTKTS